MIIINWETLLLIFWILLKKKIKEDLPRNDYREFLELIIIFLGGTPLRDIILSQPDAYHLARWMAKAIYCFKIYLFRHQV
jgi:hypothetical protein